MDTTPRSALLATGLVLGVLGLTASACGTRVGPPTAGTEPRHVVDSPTHTGRLAEDRLKLALLDLNDLPTGWAADSKRAAEERGIGVPNPDEQPCRALFDPPAKVRADGRFARTEAGPFVTTRTVGYRSAGEARRALENFRKAAAGCGVFKIVEGPEEDRADVSYTAEDLPLPKLGDGSVALRFVRGGPGDDQVTVLADVVFVRVGGAAVHLAQAGVDGTADQEERDGEERDEREGPEDGGVGPDEEEVRDGDGAAERSAMLPLAHRAVEKLRAVVDNRTPRPTGSFPDVTQLKIDPYARTHE
ncbi:hypothetical protein H3146_01295 [Streptomyces sp. OF3]|uniref:PknH-like extracellular domain-containing protein n=1 Tax=Streptomyces alkaliterrae TaxID=2213162 RepID=A0A7W3WGL4_9ACTN|nr:hypothetical protein [Streptomyces alkaliterrae]MBB1252003.1 hypothetical protein [Streptomyces alkaliterrae]